MATAGQAIDTADNMPVPVWAEISNSSIPNGEQQEEETMGEAQDVLDELRAPAKALRQAAPEAWSGFVKMRDGAMAEGALTTRAKELIALAIAVVKHCDGCISAHAKGAARQGATPGEVAEALSVALIMDGGPATVYGPRAWAAYEEFASAAAESGAARVIPGSV